MAYLGATCPHCFKENVAFQSVGQIQHQNNEDRYTVFFRCGACEKGLMATVHIKHRPQRPVPPHIYDADLNDNLCYNVVETYPKPPVIEIPQHLPDNMSNFYLQAAKSIRQENWDASAIMCRGIIEAAAKHLDPEFEGALYRRIDRLSDLHVITQSIKDWAHEIGIEDHVETPGIILTDAESAKRLFDFTEVFLIYVYTLPGMLRAKRESREA